jgi:hypothetical protein
MLAPLGGTVRQRRCKEHRSRPFFGTSPTTSPYLYSNVDGVHAESFTIAEGFTMRLHQAEKRDRIGNVFGASGARHDYDIGILNPL